MLFSYHVFYLGGGGAGLTLPLAGGGGGGAGLTLPLLGGMLLVLLYEVRLPCFLRSFTW